MMPCGRSDERRRQEAMRGRLWAVCVCVGVAMSKHVKVPLGGVQWWCVRRLCNEPNKVNTNCGKEGREGGEAGAEAEAWAGRDWRLGSRAWHRQWGRHTPPSTSSPHLAPALSEHSPNAIQFNYYDTHCVCECVCVWLPPDFWLSQAAREAQKSRHGPLGCGLIEDASRMSNRSRGMCVCVCVRAWGIIKVNCVENWQAEKRVKHITQIVLISYYFVASRRFSPRFMEHGDCPQFDPSPPTATRLRDGALNVGLRADCGCGCGFLPFAFKAHAPLVAPPLPPRTGYL